MNAELQFLTALQGLHTPARDAVMLFFTRLGNAGFVWIALAAILLLFRRTRRAGCILALALVCDLVLCNFILKPLVHRVRPCDLLPEVPLLIPHPSDYSFPSGHTAASFTAVAALWLAGKKQWALAALPLGVLIAFSRMYLFVHYPTDIIGGVLVGVGCGWIGAKLVEMFWQKNFAKSDL